MAQPRLPREPIMAALFNLLSAGLTGSFYAKVAAGSSFLTGVSAVAGQLWNGLPLFGPGLPPGVYIQPGSITANQVAMTLPASASSSSEVQILAGIQTAGRRLQPWGEVAAQPAMFLRHTGDDFLARRPRLPGRVEIEAEVWLYSAGGDDVDAVPETPLNYLIDAVAELLEPKGAQETQTLGIPALVTHCWLEGRGHVYPGDLGGSAIALLPIRVLVPGISPTGGPNLG